MSVYQKEKPKYFAAAIKSTLDQSLLPQELVLVLDGPITNELQTIIDANKDNGKVLIRVVPLKTNQGLGIALAKGVTACQNELIARMDTDDIMREDRLEKQYQAFLDNKNLTIVGSDIDEFTGDPSNVIGKRVVPETNKDIRQFSKKRNPFNHMTVMFKKSDVLAVGNYQALNGFEDYYLWVRLLKAGYQGMNIKESLVYARGGEDMYARRGGMNYFIYGLNARKVIYQNGLGSLNDYFVSISAHIVTSILPNRVRGFVYKKLLRQRGKLNED
nr:glycosyltransferase [Enterococcus alishanensis]